MPLIAVLPGDGIGPEVTTQARRVLEAGAAASCCGGPASGPVNSCCGGAAFDGQVDPITSNLYVNGETDVLPSAAVLASLGCGNPTALAELHAGETVLDLGLRGETFDTAFSARDLILVAGGLFLVWKATREIHHNVDGEGDTDDKPGAPGRAALGVAIATVKVLIH